MQKYRPNTLKLHNNTMLLLLICLIALPVLNGCYFYYTPFDFPKYPTQANPIGAIEGYQSRVSSEQYDMWFMPNQERFSQQHLQVWEHYLYVAQCGLTIFDISKPEQMSMIGEYVDTCGVDSLAVTDGFAYLASREFGIKVLDVRIPVKPKLVGSYSYRTDSIAPAVDLVVKGNCAYLYTPSSKLPHDHISQSKFRTGAYTGWYKETPVWQVIHIQNEGTALNLEYVETIDGIGRPKATMDHFVYATTQWTESSNNFNTNLQTISISDDCSVKVIQSQIIPSVVNDIKHYKNTLFASIGNRIWVWDISNPQSPKRLDAQYNAVGNIGDFATIDVDESRVLGEGYSLKYSTLDK